METLDQSEPYFVKCIRSNAEKVIAVYDGPRCSSLVLHDVDSALVVPPQLPLRFNDSLVLRQLRYTGMLETVRIRQSGYSIKYTFQVAVLPPPSLFLPSEGCVARFLHFEVMCCSCCRTLCATFMC